MSVLNIDLSEYDAMRSHTKELEEQVKELKEQVKGLKNGSKVILRKEIVIESVCSDIPFKHYVPEENKYVPEKSRRIIETSESFVGFEDVRLKVEEHMKDEVERSIKQRNEAIARYEEKRLHWIRCMKRSMLYWRKSIQILVKQQRRSGRMTSIVWREERMVV